MQRYSGTYRWIIAIGFWLMACAAPLAAGIYNQPAQPSAWQTNPTMSNDIRPRYEFHSSSAFTPVVGTTSYTAELTAPGAYAPQNNMLRKGPWDRPTDPPIGQLDTPVGEPLILLVLAMLYLAWRIIKPSRFLKRDKLTE